MKVIGVNGSPRKKWNTATLLNKALEGAASQGADTELIHLYDLNFRGCLSCFSCKKKGGPSYGRCAARDGLTPILKMVEESDAFILGSPIYFGTVSGAMRSFMERLMFPYHTYTYPPRSLFPRRIHTGFIYTMNVTEEWMKKLGYDTIITNNEKTLQTIFGSIESLFCFDTYQFGDYSKVVVEIFDPEKKAQRRKEVFPLDCQKAIEMGVRLTKKMES
jgi:multimeric flavodoxin WrbA